MCFVVVDDEWDVCGVVGVWVVFVGIDVDVDVVCDWDCEGWCCGGCVEWDVVLVFGIVVDVVCGCGCGGNVGEFRINVLSVCGGVVGGGCGVDCVGGGVVDAVAGEDGDDEGFVCDECGGGVLLLDGVVVFGVDCVWGMCDDV